MSRIAEKMSKKSGEKYEDIMRYIRVKISFLVLKATLLCLRSSRSLRQDTDAGGETSFLQKIPYKWPKTAAYVQFSLSYVSETV